MIDDTIIEEFHRLTVETLSHDGPPGILAGLVGELIDILEQAATFQLAEQTTVVEGETSARDGLAISPTQAAMCAGEFQRTAMFLRGLHDAIAATLERRPTRPVRVLYAGSGPYAMLAVPLMSVFAPELVRFTILDIHPVSIESAKSVVRGLGLDQSVEDFVVADACDYAIPEGAIPDIILSETMSTALEREPQVAIMRHLVAQAPEATIVPQSVRIDAYLVDTSEEIDIIVPESQKPLADSQPDRVLIGTIFTLDVAAIRTWQDLSGDRLPAATIQLPTPPSPHYRPYLFTAITTYGSHQLLTHDSSLTGIREVEEIAPPFAGRSVQFHYRLGADPFLVAEIC